MTPAVRRGTVTIKKSLEPGFKIPASLQTDQSNDQNHELKDQKLMNPRELRLLSNDQSIRRLTASWKMVRHDCHGATLRF